VPALPPSLGDEPSEPPLTVAAPLAPVPPLADELLMPALDGSLAAPAPLFDALEQLATNGTAKPQKVVTSRVMRKGRAPCHEKGARLTSLFGFLDGRRKGARGRVT
jgi:hypothetical protein